MSESNTKQMIQLNHVKFGYSDTEVLEEINLTIHEGEYVVLTGENGSGKSTLMRLILGERNGSVTCHRMGSVRTRASQQR